MCADTNGVDDVFALNVATSSIRRVSLEPASGKQTPRCRHTEVLECIDRLRPLTTPEPAVQRDRFDTRSEELAFETHHVSLAFGQTLGDFRIRYMALGIDEGNADSDVAGQLVSLFRDICSWGGVKLPEDDPARLFREVAVALHQLDRGEIPRGCCINSAWTKLYALARPDTCVIYDSRVAASLTSILDPYMADLVDSPLYEP